MRYFIDMEHDGGFGVRKRTCRFDRTSGKIEIKEK